MSVMPSTTIGDDDGIREGDFDGAAPGDFEGASDGDFVGLNLVGLKLGALLGLLVMIWNSELAHCYSKKKKCKVISASIGEENETYTASADLLHITMAMDVANVAWA